MNHLNKKAILDAVEAMNTIDSFGHMRQMLIDYMWTIDVFTNGDIIIEKIRKDGVKIKVPFTYSVPYDLIADKATQIYFSDQIKLDILLESEINGVNFYIDDYVVAYIPDEEMKLLELMGKVVTSTTEATTSKSVFCPFGN